MNIRSSIKLGVALLLLSACAWAQAAAPTSVNGIISSGAGYPTLPGFQGVSVFSSNIGTGDVDLYTVPAGKRAVLIGVLWNSTASSITLYPEVKISSVYYATAVQLIFANTATAGTVDAWTIVLEAGQSFSLHTTGTGMNFAGTAHVFDNTSNFKSAVLTTFINGNNTVYTCCSAGKTTAYVVGHIAQFYSGAATVANLFGINNTAGTLSYKWNFVQSGGSVSTANQISATISAAATANNPIIFSQNADLAFASGDFVSVNGTSTNAAQIAWINVVEQP